MVPVTGLEPVRCRQRWILSPLRLPIPSHRQVPQVGLKGIIHDLPAIDKPSRSNKFGKRHTISLRDVL